MNADMEQPQSAAVQRRVSPSLPPTLTLLRAVSLLGVGFLLGLVFKLDALPSPCPALHPASVSDALMGAPQHSSFDAPPMALLRTHFSLPPQVTRVIINVGSSKDPPTPPDDFTAVIAVEPILATAMAIPQHPLTFVIVAAISNATGFANFFTYNRNGESSTLADLPDAIKHSTHSSKWWAQDKYRPENVPRVLFVPVLTLAMLLEAVPRNVRVAFLKTDMQCVNPPIPSPCTHTTHKQHTRSPTDRVAHAPLPSIPFCLPTQGV